MRLLMRSTQGSENPASLVVLPSACSISSVHLYYYIIMRALLTLHLHAAMLEPQNSSLKAPMFQSQNCPCSGNQEGSRSVMPTALSLPLSISSLVSALIVA